MLLKVFVTLAYQDLRDSANYLAENARFKTTIDSSSKVIELGLSHFDTIELIRKESGWQ
jgi:hypothetical protein